MKRIVENLLASGLNIKRLNDLSEINTLVFDKFASDLISIAPSYLILSSYSLYFPGSSEGL